MEIGTKGYMLFDGDCGVCTVSSEKAEAIDKNNLFTIAPYQRYSREELAEQGIDYDRCGEELHVISPTGKVYRGAFAVNAFLWNYYPWKILVAILYIIPIFLLLEIPAYKLIAKNRHHISRWLGLTACAFTPPQT